MKKHRAVRLSGACYSRLSKLLGLLGRSGDGSALYAVAAGEFVLVLVELADLVEPVAYAVVAYVHNGKVRCGVYELDLALYQRSYVAFAAEILLESYNDLITNMDFPIFRVLLCYVCEYRQNLQQ